jgi:hypothetical protein
VQEKFSILQKFFARRDYLPSEQDATPQRVLENPA